ncbi:dimethylaniline monooxygenase [N-oxide-forming] 2-like [Ptychodera flava]|uniref:dimethylaniline monooxygenase [N-oxide-forming] 2-like n=1 Tax=Ptychodera flava TaxID=63121 RepID=UPI00396A3155
METKRIAVIGAGVCGLVSIKSCLEEGLHPVCYEQNNDIGGVWVYSEALRPNQGSAVYECLVTNSSKEMTCFSDFPMPRKTPPYVPHATYLQYLRDYAQHFTLYPYINFNTTVVSVSKAEDYATTGRWEVRTRNNDTGQENVVIFDGVMVCSGMFKDATIPDYPGLDEFEGITMHSNAFRSGSKFTDKNVLVVGGAHSAGDISVDSSRFASQVYLSMRNGTWVIPRLGFGGIPSDMMGNTRFVSKLPAAIREFMVTNLASSKVNHDKAGLQSKAKSFFKGCQMVNDEIGSRIYCGKIQAKPAITRFTKSGAEFEDGSRVEDIDVVIFATGYHLGYKFIDNSIIADSHKDLELYEYVFPARLKHCTLAVVGCVAILGANVPVYELQARWAARVFSGKAKLPGPTQRVLEVRRRQKQTLEDYGRYKTYVPPVPLQEYYAKQIGAQPRILSLLLSDPKLAFKCLFGPAYPTTYRLHGPGSWHGAKKSIEEAWDNVISSIRTRSVAKEKHSNSIILKLFIVFTLVLVIVMHWI